MKIWLKRVWLRSIGSRIMLLAQKQVKLTSTKFILGIDNVPSELL